MTLKEAAIRELDAIMKEYEIGPTRLGRELFNDASFIRRLKQPETRVTDRTLDRIFRYAVTLRGQVEMSLIVGKPKERK